MSIHYYFREDGIHTIIATQNQQVDVSHIIEKLVDIHQHAQNKPCYVLMDFSTQYHLPLRTFVMSLKQFYKANNSNHLRVAIVVQPSMVRVLEAVIKTLVSRDFIQYFTNQACAIAWINQERGQNLA